MTASTTVTTYDRVSRFNHWLFAIAFLGMLGLGLFLGEVEVSKETKRFLMGIHKATGSILLIFAIWRVGWRLKQGFPPIISNGPAWQLRLAHWSHRGLLLAIVLMPLSGMAGSLLGGRNIDVFGWFIIPAITKNELLKNIAGEVHTITAYAVAIILLLHIGAAIKHHFIDRDRTLTRMLTGRTTEKFGSE